MKYREHTVYIRMMDDRKILQKLAVKRPSWHCGEHRWRQWKLALREEAERRGLLS